MDLVLGPRSLADELGSPRDAAAQHTRLLVAAPDLGKHVAREQSRQHPSVDRIRLDLGVGDRAEVAGVGDHDAGDEGLEEPSDRQRVARRLEPDMVV